MLNEFIDKINFILYNESNFEKKTLSLIDCIRSFNNENIYLQWCNYPDRFLIQEKISKLFKNFMSVSEYNFAKLILKNHVNVNLQIISDFFDGFLIKEYKYIRNECGIVNDTNIKAHYIVIVGSGSIPISAICYAANNNKEIVCIDKNCISLRISKQLINKIGINNIRFEECDAVNMNYNGFDIAVITAGSNPKDRIIAQIRKTTDTPIYGIIRKPIFLGEILHEPCQIYKEPQTVICKSSIDSYFMAQSHLIRL